MASSMFLAICGVAGIFLLGFLVSWMIFKTIEHYIRPSVEIKRPDQDPTHVHQLRVAVEETRRDTEDLRLKTEQMRLRALQTRAEAMKRERGRERDDSSRDVDTT